MFDTVGTDDAKKFFLLLGIGRPVVDTGRSGDTGPS
jgi:hypothetical protein